MSPRRCAQAGPQPRCAAPRPRPDRGPKAGARRRGARPRRRAGRAVGGRREGRRQPAGPPRRGIGAQGRPARRPVAARRPAAPRGGPRRPPGPKGLGGDQVEGRQAVRELLLAGTRKVREVWVAGDQDDALVLDDIAELAQSVGVPVRDVTRAKLASAARTEAPQGVLARAARCPRSSSTTCSPASRHGVHPFLLVVDGVTDPGNLGALLRSAECAGVTGVVLPRHRAVHITPTVTKAAAGSIEYLPMTLVGGLPTAIRHLQEAGVWVVGLDASGPRSLFDLDLADRPVALVLGPRAPACPAWCASAATSSSASRSAVGSARSTSPPPARWPASRSPDGGRPVTAQPSAPTRRRPRLVAAGGARAGGRVQPVDVEQQHGSRPSARRRRSPSRRATPASIRVATSASTPRASASSAKPRRHRHPAGVGQGRGLDARRPLPHRRTRRAGRASRCSTWSRATSSAAPEQSFELRAEPVGNQGRRRARGASRLHTFKSGQRGQDRPAHAR